MRALRIAVVGPCASGKSTVVAELRARGYDAYAVAQEHSIVAKLWQHQHPDRLVVLEVSLATLRARRGDPNWPEWIYVKQLERLEDARAHADVHIATDAHSATAVVDQIVAGLGDANSRVAPPS